MKEVYLQDHRIEHDGLVWTVDVKIWPATSNRKGRFKVYRVHGDVTNEAKLEEALQLEADAMGLRQALEKH